MPDQTVTITAVLADRFTSVAGRINAAMGEISKRVNGVREAFAPLTGTFATLAGGIGAVLSLKTALEKSEAAVVAADRLKVALGGSEAQFNRIKKAVKDMAAQSVFGMTDMMTAAETLRQRGVELMDLPNALRATMETASALRMPLDVAGEQIARIYSGMVPRELGFAVPELRKIKGEAFSTAEAIDILLGKFSGMSEAYAKTDSGSDKMTEKKLSEAMKRVGDVFRPIKDELLLAFALAVERLGKNMQSPAFRSFLDVMTRIGIAVMDNAGKIIGLVAGLKLLQTAATLRFAVLTGLDNFAGFFNKTALGGAVLVYSGLLIKVAAIGVVLAGIVEKTTGWRIGIEGVSEQIATLNQRVEEGNYSWGQFFGDIWDSGMFKAFRKLAQYVNGANAYVRELLISTFEFIGLKIAAIFAALKVQAKNALPSALGGGGATQADIDAAAAAGKAASDYSITEQANRTWENTIENIERINNSQDEKTRKATAAMNQQANEAINQQNAQMIEQGKNDLQAEIEARIEAVNSWVETYRNATVENMKTAEKLRKERLLKTREATSAEREIEVKALQQQYEDKKISLEEYFKRRLELTVTAIQAEANAAGREVARLEMAVMMGNLRGDNTEGIQKELEAAYERKLAISNKLRAAIVENTAEETKALKDQTKALQELNDELEIRELRAAGRDRQADLLKLQQEHRKEMDNLPSGTTAGQVARIRQMQADEIAAMKNTQSKEALADLNARLEKTQRDYNDAIQQTNDLMEVGSITRQEAFVRNQQALKGMDGDVSALQNDMQGMLREGILNDADVQILQDRLETISKSVEQAAEEWEKGYRTAAHAARDAALQMQEETRNSTSSFLFDLVKGVKTAQEAFADFVQGIADAMLRIVTDRIAEKFVAMLAGGPAGGGIFGGLGRILGFAEGGMVPGRGTGDTVPAMLTPGEFIIPRPIVDNLGADYFWRLIGLGSGFRPSMPETIRGRVPMATGGLVQAAPGSVPGGSGPTPAYIVANDHAVEQLLAGGRSAMLNWLSGNAGAVNSSLET